jgi:ABC-type antimicrobial peptide transport system permease subunit
MIRLWHAAIALLAAVALVGQTVLVIHHDSSVVNLFSYFTIQSNILVMIAAALIAVRPDRGGTAFGILRLAGLVGITITGIIFATVLAGTADFEGLAWWYDKIFHYVVPAMAVIGFVFLAPRTRLTKSSLWFVAWAVAWLAYTLIRGAVSHPGYQAPHHRLSDVPYDFLDADQHGGFSVAVVSVVVTVFALALAWGYVRLSQRSAGSATAA